MDLKRNRAERQNRSRTIHLLPLLLLHRCTSNLTRECGNSSVHYGDTSVYNECKKNRTILPIEERGRENKRKREGEGDSLCRATFYYFVDNPTVSRVTQTTSKRSLRAAASQPPDPTNQPAVSPEQGPTRRGRSITLRPGHNPAADFPSSLTHRASHPRRRAFLYPAFYQNWISGLGSRRVNNSSLHRRASSSLSAVNSALVCLVSPSRRRRRRLSTIDFVAECPTKGFSEFSASIERATRAKLLRFLSR